MSTLDLAGASGAASMVVLVGGFAYAAWADWRTREVSDRLWQLLAIAGLLLGLVAAIQWGGGAALAWLVVALLVLEHLLPWDVRLERWAEWLPGVVELLVYVAVGAGLLLGAYWWGLGSNGVPVPVVEVYLTVLFARGLFEARVLYGGADAKALMVAGLLVPVDGSPWLHLPATATTVLAIYPFAVTVLFNAALLSLAVPIYLALRNLRAGSFEFPRGFTGYRIPVATLPDRFVWLRDPTFQPSSEEEEIESSDDDRRLRERQRDELIAAGATEVWVTPQVPFVVVLAVGAVLGLLAGNLAFDVFALL